MSKPKDGFKDHLSEISSINLLKKGGILKIPQPEEAEEELDSLVEYCIVTVKISDERQPRCFDITKNSDLRNTILALILENYEY